MIKAFTPGTRVSFYTGNSTQAKAFISDYLKTYHWLVPGYLGDGFYHIITTTGKALIMYEDSLTLAPVTLKGALDHLYDEWQAGIRQDDDLYDAIQIIEKLNRGH